MKPHDLSVSCIARTFCSLTVLLYNLAVSAMLNFTFFYILILINNITISRHNSFPSLPLQIREGGADRSHSG